MNNLKFEVFANSRNLQYSAKLKFRDNETRCDIFKGQFIAVEKLEDKKGEKHG